MNTLDVMQYGFPVSEGYAINTDLALLRTEAQSGWFRQRRTFLHNASIIKLTWRLHIYDAKRLNTWLQLQPIGQFFFCDLLSGNDLGAPSISPVAIRRVSTVNSVRIPMTDMFMVSFDAETQFQVGYNEYAALAADEPPTTYPANFSMPMASTFSDAHDNRNVTTYNLSYMMTSETLAEWLVFAGFQGTAWFWHPMVSINIPCGIELIRYISEPGQTLTAPNIWTVTIQAECKPSSIILDEFMPPVDGDCYYNSDIEYNDAAEEYDCDGGVVPPQGNFTMPTGTVVVNNNTIGDSPLTATALIKLNSNGTVETSPAGVPTWSAWHTDPSTLPSPVVKLSIVVEISRDNGATWTYYTPAADGPWLDLKTHNIWIRNTLTSTYDVSNSKTVLLTFDSDTIPTPFGVQATATVELAVVLNVNDPTGVVDGAAWADGFIYTIDPGEEVESVSAGVTFMSDGRVIGQSGNQLLGLWFDPQQINAGQGLWVLLTGGGSGSGPPEQKSFPPTGVRMSMAVNNYFTAIAGAVAGGNFANVTWTGAYQVYNAQTGGTLLGSGTINLESEVSQ